MVDGACKISSINQSIKQTQLVIHLLIMYKLTPIGHIVYNFYHFKTKILMAL